MERGHFKDNSVKHVLDLAPWKVFSRHKMKIIPSIPKRKLIWNWRTGTLAGYTHESPPHLAGTGKQSNVVVEGAISRSESKYQLHALLCDLGKLPNFSKLQFSYLQNDSDNSPYSAEWW